MLSLLKLGIAVVCLLVVAAFLAFDTYRKAPAEVAAPPPAAPVASAVPVAPPPPPMTPEPEKKPVPVGTPVVVIPPVVKKAPLIETLPSGARVYTVVQGDTLYGISVKVFGTPRHYERIYEANREQIQDPNTLQVGAKLTLPEVGPKPAAAVPVSSSTGEKQ